MDTLIVDSDIGPFGVESTRTVHHSWVFDTEIRVDGDTSPVAGSDLWGPGSSDTPVVVPPLSTRAPAGEVGRGRRDTRGVGPDGTPS